MKTRESEGGRRAQLFSLDLLIAAAVLAFSIGAVLQLQESAQRHLAGANAVGGSAAEAIADSMTGGLPVSAAGIAHCAVYSNGTDGCSSFSCAGAVSAARRITACADGPCALELRACG